MQREFGGYLPLELPAHEIRFLCERHLAQAAVPR